MARLLVE